MQTRSFYRVTCTLAIAAFTVLVTACGGKDTAPPPANATAPARAVSVAMVELRPLGGNASASGLLVPREEAAVGSELSGFRVAEVLVEEGAVVRAGQPLARLDDTLLRARIHQAQAAVLQAQAQGAQAQSESDRVKGLDGTGILSDEAIAERRTQASSAQAGVGVAQAQLNDLMTQAGRMTVRAPVAGLVLERKVRVGAVAGVGGDPMFRIARGRLLELDAEVAEDALAAIAVGSSATVSLPTGVTFEGTVRHISPRVDPQTKLGWVRVALPVDAALRAGGFARASFKQWAKPVPTLPEKAVQFEASGPLITVIGANNLAKRIPVRTGARAGGFVELLEGRPPGTRVALGGGVFLLDGDLVAPTVVSAPSDAVAPPPAAASSAAALPQS
jgi:HlyD family secretion protein